MPPHSSWSTNNKVHNVGPWLRGLRVQDGRRSFYTLKTVDLQQNHHSGYLHSVKIKLNDSAMQPNPMRRGGVQGASQSRDKELGQKVVDCLEIVLWYLGKKKAELDHVGYCVLEGFLDHGTVPKGKSKSLYDRNLAWELLSFYEQIDHEAPRPSNSNVNTVWWKVKKDNYKGPCASEKRYITFRYELMKHIERDGSTSQPAAVRAALNVRALQMCVLFGVEEDGHQELASPLSGSRIKTHSKEVKRHIPHTDFDVSERAAERVASAKNASCPVVWTGEDALWLIFWERLHKFFQRISQHSIVLAKVMPPRKVAVPTFSCAVPRGNAWHAGTDDENIAEREKSTGGFLAFMRCTYMLANRTWALDHGVSENRIRSFFQA